MIPKKKTSVATHTVYVVSTTVTYCCEFIRVSRRSARCRAEAHDLHVLSTLLATSIRSIPLQLDKLITHSFPLDRIEDAWELQASGQCAKVVLKPWH